MNCPSCDAENMDGADRCWSCGASLKDNPEAAANRSSTSWVIYALLGVAGVLIFGLLLSAGTGASSGGGAVTTGTIDATGSAETTVTTPTVPATESPVPGS